MSAADPGASSEVVRLDGHVVDSLLLPKVLDAIVDAGASYEILELEMGTTALDQSHVRIRVSAPDEPSLDALLADIQVHGVNREDASDAALMAAPADGVLPSDFYSTTNLATSVRVDGRWIPSGRPEMDCALVVEPASPSSPVAPSVPRVLMVPMHRVRAGDRVVVGWRGVRVETPSRADDAEGFGFMTSEVSSEKPKAVSLSRVAASIREARDRRVRGTGGGRVLVVCGPAVVHTGAAPALARLVREGWVQLLFAGNGFATHDIESNVLGTSLGVSLGEGVLAEHGHANHLRVINEVRRFGSIAAAVEAGWLRGGVLYECVRAGSPSCSEARYATTDPFPT